MRSCVDDSGNEVKGAGAESRAVELAASGAE